MRLLLVLLLVAVPSHALAQRQMERLGRGVVAVPRAEGGVLVTWRLLGVDPEETAFNVYRSVGDGEPVRVNAAPIDGADGHGLTAAGDRHPGARDRRSA